MVMKKLFMLVFVSVLGLSFFGCGTPPVYNVNNMSIAVAGDKKATMEDVVTEDKNGGIIDNFFVTKDALYYVLTKSSRSICAPIPIFLILWLSLKLVRDPFS